MNPPKVLKAIISPDALGGWSGAKLRDPTDGGGAPCPKEFIRKQREREEIRTTDDATSTPPGRQHPQVPVKIS